MSHCKTCDAKECEHVKCPGNYEEIQNPNYRSASSKEHACFVCGKSKVKVNLGMFF